MPTLTGTVNSFRFFPGWGRVADVVIDGQQFYKRLGQWRCPRVQPGSRVRVTYEPASIYGADGIWDRLVLARIGWMPRDYNEITSLENLEVPEA